MRNLWIAIGLALLLSGCASRAEQPAPTAEQTVPNAEQTASPTIPPVTAVPPDGEIPFSGADRIRVDYRGNEQWARYITSPEQLPENPALESFDAGFFRDNALVLVKVTMTSGSILPELEAIRCSDGCAVVSVRRTAPGGDMTDDMATWLLWARVDRDLNCQWMLEGEEAPPAGEKY